MTSRILYGFSIVLLMSNVWAHWNETDFFTINGRDSRRIRNKLVTFDTLDTDIELAFQFNVPFVAVPTDRSVGNIQNSIASFVNINIGSVVLAGVMILFGSLTASLWTTLLPRSSAMNTDTEDTNSTTTEATESPDSTFDIDDDSTTTVNENPKQRADEGYKFMNLMDLLDAAVNPTMCVQQYICSLSKLSAKNVAEGCATSSDKIIAGIFEAPWVLDTISGTAIHDAIQFGESTGDCKRKFSRCGLANADSKVLITKLLKSFNVFI